MNTCIVQANYQGASDNYFVPGNTYNLMLHQGWFGRIHIVPTHGYDYKPYVDIHESYNNLGHFLSHWRIDKLVQDNNTVFFRAVDNA